MMNDEAPESRHAESLTATNQSTTKQNTKKSRSSGEKKEGRRLVDDVRKLKTATLVGLALQASGAQQEVVDEKIEKLRKRTEARASKPAASDAAQRGRDMHKSKKLREMKEHIKSNKGNPKPKARKDGDATKSKSQSSRKQVAFQ